jgi:HK97 family phage portal protein
MKLYQRLGAAVRRFFAAVTGSSTLSDAQQWLVDWVRGSTESDAGVSVNDTTSMGLAAVWYSVNRIAGDVGLLPLIEYKRTPGENRDNRQRAKDQAAYSVVKTSPNGEMTASVFKETLTAHALLRGNGYAYIERQQATGKLLGLIPLPHNTTFPYKVYEGDSWRGQLWYKTTFHLPSGKSITKVFRPEDVLHIRGLGWDGLIGHSIVTLARQSFGLTMAAEKHGARYFKNSARPGVILEAPPGAFKSEEQARQFLADWDGHHSGVDNATKTGLLLEGVKANVVSLSNEDSQWLESRKFQRVEVALWFGLEYITGDDSSVSYNSLEQKALAYLQSTLQRWLVRWQEECDLKLLTEKQKSSGSHYFEFLTAAMLRGSTLDRYKAYEIGRRNEWLSADDVRELENLNERPDGEGNEYKNPNVKSIASGKSEMDEADHSTSPLQSGLSIRALVRSRLEALYADERRKVLNAASRSKAFGAWADRFYKKWSNEVYATFAELGGSAELAKAEIERSQNEILEAMARARRGDLPNVLENVTAQWLDRPAKVTDQILRQPADMAA